ncbi:protein kinase domain-containing protein [Nannocystis pusilla]|uniref:protein kinase domain-containing protein n=1 Tax=Nannocystis pusilla TaxID=889268 RepID=UPI003B7F9C52
MVHRDFKPANVIVGDDGRVRVVDFGLAHFGDSEALPELPAAGEPTDVLLTQTGAVLGTPAYMAAEQFAGARGDAKTDQYSFCAALYEALYGQRPFVGADVQALATAVAGAGCGRRSRGRRCRRGCIGWCCAACSPTRGALAVDGRAAAGAAGDGHADPRAASLRRDRLGVRASGRPRLHGVERRAAPAAPQDEVAAARAEVTRAQDAKLLTEARAALTRDPVVTIRALAQLTGDDPGQWNEARFFAAAASARGCRRRCCGPTERWPRRCRWPTAASSAATSSARCGAGICPMGQASRCSSRALRSSCWRPATRRCGRWSARRP